MINEIKSFKRQKKIIYTIHFYQGKKLFVCLFVWSLSSHSRIFHSYGDIIAGEGLHILT